MWRRQSILPIANKPDGAQLGPVADDGDAHDHKRGLVSSSTSKVACLLLLAIASCPLLVAIYQAHTRTSLPLDAEDLATLPPELHSERPESLAPQTLEKKEEEKGGDSKASLGAAHIPLQEKHPGRPLRPPEPETRGDGYSLLSPVEELLRRNCGGQGAEAGSEVDFGCAAQCAAREPELERSLAPFAEWESNSSALKMLNIYYEFCMNGKRCHDPFIVLVLWRESVYIRTCRAKLDYKDVGLYLIGPEDLSLVVVILLQLLKRKALPEAPLVFGIYLSDYTCLQDRHVNGPVPMFAYLARDTSSLIPWPSSFTIYSTLEMEELQAKQASELFRWSSKKSKAYWIGAITGPFESVPHAALRALPRMKALLLARQHTDLLQVEWSSAAAYGVNWIRGENVSGLGGERPRPIEEFTGRAKAARARVEAWYDYKYYLNLDGVVMGGRTNKLMQLGGVPLQHEAGYREYLDALMEPFEHYVPVKYDLSDLVQKVTWLRENDDVAQQIAEKAQKLANTRMRFQDHVCYIWRALKALAKVTTASPVSEVQLENALRKLEFSRVRHKGDMVTTLETMWGNPLEKVQLGDRLMTKNGIRLLQWAWDYFERIQPQEKS
mmetsp:Transcript_51542/g.122603  ORF Transcript_51542/g.122603 Transcript_51542/m.122603 type:complete len:609 (-) Transcript_51542:102-1928(-)